jgi:hypothetical protein
VPGSPLTGGYRACAHRDLRASTKKPCDSIAIGSMVLGRRYQFFEESEVAAKTRDRST